MICMSLCRICQKLTWIYLDKLSNLSVITQWSYMWKTNEIQHFRTYLAWGCSYRFTIWQIDRQITSFFSVSIGFCWFYGSVWCVFAMFTKHGFVPEGFLTSCTFDYISQDQNTRTFIMLMIIFGFILPVFTMAVFYTLIFIHIRKHTSVLRTNIHYSSLLRSAKIESRQNNTNSESDLNASNNSRQQPVSKIIRQMTEIKILRSSLTMILVFCIAWLPFAVLVIFAQFTPNRSAYLTPKTSIFPTLFAKLSSVLNPIVYGFTNKGVFKYFRSFFPKLRLRYKTKTLLVRKTTLANVE
jgi:r-opsin